MSESKDTEINASGKGGTPDDPTDFEGRNWKQLLKRTLKEFQKDNLTDWAAALTYYAILALFPALLVLVALLGHFGRDELAGAQIFIERLAELRAALNGLSGI